MSCDLWLRTVFPGRLSDSFPWKDGHRDRVNQLLKPEQTNLLVSISATVVMLSLLNYSIKAGVLQSLCWKKKNTHTHTQEEPTLITICSVFRVCEESLIECDVFRVCVCGDGKDKFHLITLDNGSIIACHSHLWRPGDWQWGGLKMLLHGMIFFLLIEFWYNIWCKSSKWKIYKTIEKNRKRLNSDILINICFDPGNFQSTFQIIFLVFHFGKHPFNWFFQWNVSFPPWMLSTFKTCSTLK